MPAWQFMIMAGGEAQLTVRMIRMQFSQWWVFEELVVAFKVSV
jgi:hypothetical protein